MVLLLLLGRQCFESMVAVSVSGPGVGVESRFLKLWG